TCTCLPFAAVDGDFLQIAPERIGHHLTHAQGGAGRRIDLVPVVRLDDLDVDLVAEHPRGGVQQLEAKIHANAEVGGEDDRDLLGRGSETLLLVHGKSSGADHHRLTSATADFQVLQGDRRVGEIDQHVELVED